MITIDDLNPRTLWQYFKALTQIPRPSYHEEAVRDYVTNEAKRLNLWVERDDAGNILVRKPATKGCEHAAGIILQAHLDMVPQKNNDKEHDFTKDPIETLVKGEWLTANGTTLGADNGIGAAAALAVLADTQLRHGPVEALFTATEECGMDGAKGLRKNWLQGDILLNLDSEDEGELYIGCAGGVDVELDFPMQYEPNDKPTWQLTLKGLCGGHSGLNIIDQRGNANILLMRILDSLNRQEPIYLATFNGGSLRNAIPREAQASFATTLDETTLRHQLDLLTTTLRAELPPEDSSLTLELQPITQAIQILNTNSQHLAITAVLNCPNGVIRMSQSMKGLVETSNNLAKVVLDRNNIALSTLLRSSNDDAKADSVRRMTLLAETLGGQAHFSGDYSGWQPKPEAPIVKVMQETGCVIFGQTPALKGIHAGLECGILGEHYPHWQMISFGPTITGAHSPDEQVNIPSVSTFWQWLTSTLDTLADMAKS